MIEIGFIDYGDSEDTYCSGDAPFARGQFADPQEILDTLKPQAERINPEELEKWRAGKMVEER